MLFLQEAALDFGNSLTSGDVAVAGGLLGGLLAFLMAIIVFVIIVAVGMYIYMSFAFMAIAKRTGTKPAGIAWIPSIGPLLLSSKIAKMHWWPILFLAGVWIPILNWFLIVALAVFAIIWMWKTFIAVGRPGWWAILALIPIVNIAYIVLLGIAAWGGKKQVVNA